MASHDAPKLMRPRAAAAVGAATVGAATAAALPVRPTRPLPRRSSYRLTFAFSLLVLVLAISMAFANPRVLTRFSACLTVHVPARSRPSTLSSPASFLSSLKDNFLPRRSIITSSMAPDKYSTPPQAPPTFTGTKTSIVDDATALCDTTRSLLDKLVADIPADKASYASVLAPVVEDEDISQLSARILGFYQYVSADEDLRNASTEATKLMDDFGIECNMREDVFQLVDAAFQAQKEKEPSLEPELVRLLEKERKGYLRNGLGLPKGPQRDRFKEIKKSLSQITIQFQKSLNEEKGFLWFTKEELDGVPADLVDNWEKGTGENEGKVKLTFKYPDLFPTLKFAKNPETRKKLFIANENKVWISSANDRLSYLYSDPVQCSATKTFPSSRKRSSSVTKLPDCSDTPATPPSASRRRWPRSPRPSTHSSPICELVWPLAALKRRIVYTSLRRRTRSPGGSHQMATTTSGTTDSTTVS